MQFRLWGILGLAGAIWWGSGLGVSAQSEQGHYNAAVNLYNAGQWQAAVAKIDERLKANADDAWRSKYTLARGLAFEKGGRSSEARAAYRDLLKQWPQAAEAAPARLALLYLDYAAGDGASVRSLLKEMNVNALGADDRRNVHLMGAETAYVQGDTNAAWAGFQAALAAGADRVSLAPKLFDLAVRLQKPADILTWSDPAPMGVESGRLALVRAEALAGLNRWPQARQEAARVPVSHAWYPRAAYIQARALIQEGQLTNALPYLEVAVRDLRDPPVPPATHLALAECRLAAGDAAGALRAIDDAERRMKDLPESERAAFERELTAARLRMIAGSGDSTRIIRAVTEARSNLPPNQAASLLYLRLHAWDREQRRGPLLAAMAEDFPILQKGTEDGPATLIYHRALTAERRGDEARAVLHDFLKRRPAAPEALSARLLLAREAIDRKEWPVAREQLSALLALPAARTLDAAQLRDLQFNWAVAAYQEGRDDEVLRLAATVAPAATNDGTAVEMRVMAGQSAFRRQDYRAARTWWEAALKGAVSQPARIHQQIAAASMGLRDFAAAAESYEKAAAADARILTADSEVNWVRALYRAGRFAEAAERGGRLAARLPDQPDLAYETALAYARAERPAEAEKFYRQALQRKDRLTPEYAARIETDLAVLQTQHGLGGGGFDFWLGRLAPGTADTPFAEAVQALRARWTRGDRFPADARRRLEEAQRAYAPTQSRFYLLAALRVQDLAADSPAAADALAVSAVEAWVAHETGLTPFPGDAGLTPAILYFYRGEAARRRGDPVAALADYETVLSVYPCNEWPDAAAVGVAECFAALGNLDEARNRLAEVAAQPTNSLSAAWIRRAQTRLEDFNKPKGKP